MDRRQFLAASVVSSLGLSRFGFAADQGQQAIAEGGALAPPKDRPVNVAIPISAWNTWIDFIGPDAVFQTYHKDPADGKYKPRFKPFFVAEKLEPTGKIFPDYTFETAPPAEIILVGAQKGSDALIKWLKETSSKTEITMSVCTGAYHLAEAGILDGLKATSHHESIADLKKKYPKVEWISGMRFVEGKRISTGGGLTAGIDLALRVTERYHGREWAKEVATHIEYQGLGWMT